MSGIFEGSIFEIKVKYKHEGSKDTDLIYNVVGMNTADSLTGFDVLNADETIIKIKKKQDLTKDPMNFSNGIKDYLKL